MLLHSDENQQDEKAIYGIRKKNRKPCIQEGVNIQGI